jgi:hypothetical protein
MLPPFHNDPLSQAKTFSAQFGALAAESAAPADPRTRLAAALQHLRRRERARRDAHDKLRAHEFIRT